MQEALREKISAIFRRCSEIEGFFSLEAEAVLLSNCLSLILREERTQAFFYLELFLTIVEKKLPHRCHLIVTVDNNVEKVVAMSVSIFLLLV